MSGLVASVLVLPRGVAKEMPTKYETSDADLAAARAAAGEAAMELEDGVVEDDHERELKHDKKAKQDSEEEEEDEDAMETESTARNPDDPFDMAHYDDEPDDAIFHQALSNVAVGRDPYLKSGDAMNAEEVEDVLIRREDIVLLAAVSEDDELSHLDVYVYEPDKDNLYVHHDYMLPAFPLALSWLSFPVGAERADETRTENLVAIATFEPYIEIWDLDTYDQPAPLAVLGGPADPKDFGKKLTKKLLQPDSHTDAILGLAWNRSQRNLLASASADGSVKLWDLCTGGCLKTLRHHGGAKVQCLQWNPAEAALLATGAYDRRCAVVDVRSDSAVALGALDADAETLTWLPPPNHATLLVATEKGTLFAFDVQRGLAQPLWKLSASSKPLQALAVSSLWSHSLLATGSADKTAPIKLWQLRGSAAPTLVWEGGAELGAVYSLSFSPDSPFLLVAGVQGERPAVIDLSHVDAVKQRHAQWTSEHPDANADSAAQSSSNNAPMAPGTLSSAISSSSSSSSSNSNQNNNANKNNNNKKGKGKGKGR